MVTPVSKSETKLESGKLFLLKVCAVVLSAPVLQTFHTWEGGGMCGWGAGSNVGCGIWHVDCVERVSCKKTSTLFIIFQLQIVIKFSTDKYCTSRSFFFSSFIWFSVPKKT